MVGFMNIYKNIFSICILVGVFCCSNSKGTKARILEPEGRVEFIGYYKSFPVFNDSKSMITYISHKTGEFEVFRDYEKLNAKALFTKNGQVYLSKSGKILVNDYLSNKTDSIGIEGKASFIVANNGGDIVYRDKTLYLRLINQGYSSVEPTGIKGVCVDLNGQTLTFVESSRSGDGQNVVQCSIDDIKDRKYILRNIYADPLVMSPRGTLFLCILNAENDSKRVGVYDLEEGMKFFPATEREWNTWAYYSNQEKAFVFYNYTNGYVETEVVEFR